MIVTPPHPALRTRAAEANPKSKNTADLVRRLEKAMRAHPGAIGLAANQIGSLRRVIVWALPGQRISYAINPVFTPTPHSETHKGTEGCLSLPGIQGRVRRYRAGTLHYSALGGEEHDVRCDGLFARIIQHECDHLDGILFTDTAEDITTTPRPENADHR